MPGSGRVAVSQRRLYRSSATVFKELAAAGVKKNDVDKIQIGYRWVTAKDSTKVTLKPEWYFESHSTWHAVFDYLNQK